MHILGLNAYHGDASAALLDDDRLICAMEEERFHAELLLQMRLEDESHFGKLGEDECAIPDLDQTTLTRSLRLLEKQGFLKVINEKTFFGYAFV
jgi:carbamoyltransferase